MERFVKILASVLFSICIVSIGFWLYIVFDSAFCRNHLGIVLVVVGFIGAFIFGHEEKKTLGKKLAWWFDMILLIGLLLEMREAVNEDSKILALQRELQPRTIAPEQRTALINLLKDCPKGTVVIWAGAFDGEATQYASQIEDVLTNSGYDVVRPAFPSMDAIVSLSQPGLALVVKDLKHPPRHAGPIQACFQDCGISMPGVSGDSNFPPDRVVIGVGQHF